MKKKVVILIIMGIFLFLVAGIIGTFIYYDSSLKPVDTGSKENITFEVKTGEAANVIAANLKREGLIKNELTLKIYIKLHPGTPLAGTYVFTKAMSAKDIYKMIIDGKVTRDTVKITFVEGKRLSYIADAITKKFDFTLDEINSVLDDKEYIKELISRYDFLQEDILKEGIYHPLEGYLFPDTYEFFTDVTVKDIIERMLDNTATKLSRYKTQIESSKYSVHELMTLASIIELEGARSKDREGVAGVFYNRLKNGWTLGSDVTTYYAVNKDFSVGLTWTDLNSCNGYNTRGTCVKGLPVGPIANPSIDSLNAVFNPKEHDNFYFVADKNGDTYFSKTESAHNAIIRDLRNKGLWYEY